MPGLRERKKADTRRALHRAAMRLFAEHGYEATTVADIAASAGVATRTFFGHFSAKDEVPFAPFGPPITDLEQALRERAPEESALEVFRRWIAGLVERDDHLCASEHALLSRLAEEHDGVAARGLQLLDRIERALAHALADDLHLDARADTLPWMAAAATVAAMRAQLLPLEPVARRAPDTDGCGCALAMADVDRGLALVRAGIAAVRP